MFEEEQSPSNSPESFQCLFFCYFKNMLMIYNKQTLKNKYVKLLFFLQLSFFLLKFLFHFRVWMNIMLKNGIIN